jgi:hypothetical protein
MLENVIDYGMILSGLLMIAWLIALEMYISTATAEHV